VYLLIRRVWSGDGRSDRNHIHFWVSVSPQLRIARQGVKLKFHDFQQTTQEHVWPVLNKDDLLKVARQAWEQRRGGRGVRLVGLHVTLQDPQIERQLLLRWDE